MTPYDPEADLIPDPAVGEPLDPRVSTEAYCDAEGCFQHIEGEPYRDHLGGEDLVFCSPQCKRRNYADYHALDGDYGPE